MENLCSGTTESTLAFLPPVDSYFPDSVISPLKVSSFTICSTVGILNPSSFAISGLEDSSFFRMNFATRLLFKLFPLISILHLLIKIFNKSIYHFIKKIKS